MVKINDRHEFPLNIDLADFVAEGEEKQKAGPDGFNYTLHGYVDSPAYSLNDVICSSLLICALLHYTRTDFGLHPISV